MGLKDKKCFKAYRTFLHTVDRLKKRENIIRGQRSKRGWVKMFKAVEAAKAKASKVCGY